MQTTKAEFLKEISNLQLGYFSSTEDSTAIADREDLSAYYNCLEKVVNNQELSNQNKINYLLDLMVHHYANFK